MTERFKAVRLFSEDRQRTSRFVELTAAELDPGEVLIRTRYAAINYKDARAVSGKGNVVKRFPCIPGIEMSGTVVESSDPRLRTGDLVTVQGGQEFGIRRDGAYSEYVRAPAAWVHPVGEGFDDFSAVALGIAAYTSALAVEELIARGITPDKGKIAVTGATGGCSSFAIDMLAGLGYRVAAITGKAEAHAYLKTIGAAEVLGREAIAPGPKPLEDQLWAGAIDAVGGAPLDALLRTMKKNGVVCAFGNAAGETFATSIYPFILRSVSLTGINGNHPVGARGSAWTRMRAGGDLRPRHLDKICYTIAFGELPAHCDKLIGGGVSGRAIVRFHD
jgi:acrylyl-CoA reductase (NADPH)